jgi:transcriptional regulator with GAF, ATPase, and Fis domain
LALVALASDPAREALSLGVIYALKLKRFQILAYGNRIFSRPIAIRCRALLCGSKSLLDSSSPAFLEELKGTLIRLWEKEADECSQDQRVAAQMRDFGLIGISQKMTSVFRWMIRISAISDFPVLITGETGTGKELIANALHGLDAKRRRGPFIVANCSAISAGLAESELFGHRRGAFTGADNERKGLFRAAEGGTLFLDEIGELSDPLQAKLLRVLQERRVRGIGFEHEIPIDVRVIAATNKRLEDLVRQGRFREDLYHRLNVLSVEVPPLRDRKEDIQALIDYFLEKYSSLIGNEPVRASVDFVRALTEIDLPGNARQLENIVRQALVNRFDDAPLSLSDLTPAVWESLAGQIRPATKTDEVTLSNESSSNDMETNLQAWLREILKVNGWNMAKSLDYCEKLLLRCALQFTHGNQSQTARLIGMTARSVYNKVHKHNLHI